MRFPSPDALQLSQSFPLAIRPMCHLALALVCLLAGILSAGDALERGFVLKRKADQSCIALVVGNAAYPDQPLKNPVNDADDTAAALERLGFTVTKVVNADRVKFQQAVEQFGKQIIGKQAAAFYYAGHGLQVAGDNYLLPLGEVLNNEAEVAYKAINAGLVLAQMEAARCPINLVVLDACRDNPLARFGRSTVKGLAQVHGPAGSMLVYSTAPGQIASDGDGRNGIFTGAFLKHLATPGQDIDLFLRVVSGEVQQASGGRQIPWRSSNLTQGFTFVPAPTTVELESEHKSRGQLLGTLEAQQAEMDRQRKVEEAVILAKQAEITEMEQKIKAAQAKMNAAGKDGASGDFGTIMNMIDTKEKQAAELVDMRRKADEARRQREAELAQLAEAERTKRTKALDADLARFRKAVSSEHGAAMKDAAWAALLKKWNVADVVVGDESELTFKIFPEKLASAAEAAAKRAFADGDRLVLEAFVSQYPQHPRVAEARRQINLIPPWASGSGKDQYGFWANLIVAGVTQRFRWIAPGMFTMGSLQVEKDAAVQADAKADLLKDEIPHQVTLTKGYWLADSACTQALWQAVTRSNPAKFTDSLHNPVEQVSWNDCQQFLISLNGRVKGGGFALPTEAQWEYACRAGTTTAFNFGTTITTDQVNYDGNFPFGVAAKYPFRGTSKGLDPADGFVLILNRQKTVPVKSLPPNAWGLYEMHGNVWQWCADWYGDYPSGAVSDPTGPSSGSRCVSRGGSWYSVAWLCRSAKRSCSAPDYRLNNLGFRLCAKATP